MFTLREHRIFMNKREIVEQTLEALHQNTEFEAHFQYKIKFGDGGGIDGELYFREPTNLPRFQVEVKQELRQYQLPQLMTIAAKQEHFLLMAERIFPTLKKELRKNKINYIDGAGNLFIKADYYTIQIEGNKHIPLKKTVINKAFNKTGLKAVFYLLLHDEAINLPYRKLAEATGVALGNIKNIIEGLKEAGFILPINKTTNKLQNKKALLERWITAYGEILQPTLLLGTYRFWHKERFQDWPHLHIDQGSTVWGGEPGGDMLTNHLNPEILTVYTTQKTNLVTQWLLVPDDNGPIKIYRKFWKDDQYDPQRFAPPLLVYADLLLTNDPRCIETADRIYKEHLQHGFE